MNTHSLAVGDRVIVGGGYDMEPAWLASSESGYGGEVIEFIPGQNEQPAAVVALDEEVVLPNGAGAVRDQMVRGQYLVLELGQVGATSSTPRPRVHVELCAEAPPHVRWQDRPRGAWVESHASYHVVV